VRLHDFELFGRKGTWLAEDGVGDADLADVVQGSAVADRVQIGGREVKLFAEEECVAGNALGVFAGDGVANRRGVSTRLDQLESSWSVPIAESGAFPLRPDTQIWVRMSGKSRAEKGWQLEPCMRKWNENRFIILTNIKIFQEV
jgi:hypothetical protein